MREEIRVLRRKISRGELIHSWSKMKQHLLFCSLLVCLPAFTAHLYSSEIGIQANSKTDTHSPLFTKITSGSYVLQLRGGGDHFSKDIQAGATTVARHARLEANPPMMQCEAFDAATLRPAKLPALKPPMPRRWSTSPTKHLKVLPDVMEDRECHCAVQGGTCHECVSEDSVMEDDMRDEEPGTSVSRTGTSTGEVENSRSGKKQLKRQLKVGDQMNSRLTITSVLGSGAFGTVYMAKDQTTGQSVAVKVQRGGSRHCQVAQDEIKLLKAVSTGKEKKRGWFAKQSRPGSRARGDSPEVSNGSGEVVKLLASFAIQGKEGPQICLEQELLGPSLLDLVIDYGYAGIALPKVRAIMRDVLRGLDYLHSHCGIIHTDVKPENVLLKLPQRGGNTWWLNAREAGEDSKLRKGWSMGKDFSPNTVGAKLVDLGNACFAGKPFTDDIQTIEYRCPEVVLGAGYDCSADLWSAACMAFELITGEYLFDPQEGVGSDGVVQYGKDEDLLALHQELLGPMPRHLALKGRLSPLLVDEQGKLLHISSLKFWGLRDVLVEKYGMGEAEAAGIADFLLPMLKFDPAERASAAEMLQHPWLQEEQ